MTRYSRQGSWQSCQWRMTLVNVKEVFGKVSGGAYDQWGTGETGLTGSWRVPAQPGPSQGATLECAACQLVAPAPAGTWRWCHSAAAAFKGPPDSAPLCHSNNSQTREGVSTR